MNYSINFINRLSPWPIYFPVLIHIWCKSLHIYIFHNYSSSSINYYLLRITLTWSANTQKKREKKKVFRASSVNYRNIENFTNLKIERNSVIFYSFLFIYKKYQLKMVDFASWNRKTLMHPTIVLNVLEREREQLLLLN